MRNINIAIHFMFYIGSMVYMAISFAQGNFFEGLILYIANHFLIKDIANNN